MVYIKEAHPVDGRQSRRNEREGILIKQPRSLSARKEVAETMCSALKIKLPALVDTMDDATSQAYSALPDRLYLIGRDGRIAYQGARGPRGFKVDELHEKIKATLDEGGGQP